MRYFLPIFSAIFGFILLIFSSCQFPDKAQFDLAQIDHYWQSGKTLPVEASKAYPLPLQPVVEDTGINVLLDIAHQCSFEMMWRTPASLMSQGLRVATSQATIHHVIDPKGHSRVRLQTDTLNRIHPFAWHENFEYNVVVTQQTSMESQPYLESEIEALKKFVSKGGGLIILAHPQRQAGEVPHWSLNELTKAFGVQLTTGQDQINGQSHVVLQPENDFEISLRGDHGHPIQVKGRFGKGYVVVNGHTVVLTEVELKADDPAEKSREALGNLIKWAAQGLDPIGGEPRLPMTHAGGGGIYPELEEQMGDIVLYYAENQIPELLHTVEVDIPKAMALVEKWLPSRPTLEPMYLILSAGGGGGWAVNAYSPKENGIISLSPFGILSIFAHELAHTMHGPPNAAGETAGRTPYPFDNRGEAHAGWFQGKIDAIFDEERQQRANRNANSMFDFDPEGNKLDLAGDFREMEGYGNGQEWTKSWYIWQKLDDRYGPTWYPRWRWVQHTRWQDEPNRRLSWEEMIEDMSIAVGEDLFPFFVKMGTSLNKNRLHNTVFMGDTLVLEVAPLGLSPAGTVRIGAIGDYTKPIDFVF